MKYIIVCAIAIILNLCLKAVAAESGDQKLIFRFMGGEQIQIQVFSNSQSTALQQVQGPQLVTGDGFISAPGAGTINIAGMTLEGATNKIAEKVKEVQALKSLPQISIAVLSLPPRWVYIEGQVARPQQLEFPKDHFLYLSAALAAVGGTMPDAELTHIQIIRNEKGAGEDADEVINMSSKSGKMPRGPILAAGDIVVVPLSESFSVTGEVNKVGVFSRGDSKVQSGFPIRLTNALSAAGGPKPSADLGSVKLIHRTPDDSNAKLESFNVTKAFEGDASQDPILQDGDKIIVGSNDGFVLLGKVKSPGVYYAPGVGSPLMLSRLIALGGGFDLYAKKTSVVIVRQESPRKTVVDLKAVIEEGKLEKDVVLKPGDMVFVGESSF